MTYNEAENLSGVYSDIIGKPLLNKMVLLDCRKITSLLISPREKIKEVFNAWWHNGNDNKKAVLNKRYANFEVFVISYDPTLDAIIYYLRLNKYIELGK
ncbi:MAG TPA: hypothetical protein VN958_14730 [Chitinophagaceae bacterium]|nr:hypothetical protein [Chitinophagaceae bacterium]